MRSSIAALLLAIASCPVSGEQGQAQFTVAVNVPVRVLLEVIEQPTELTLSAADVARGYKDVSARYRVRHNDRRGYLLQIAPRTGITSRIDINGLGAEMTLRDEVLDVRRPGQTFEQELRLEFRFVLDAGVPSGTFELPVSVAAAPI
ncbi:MAG TPA: hypothetical protein VL379_01705 [Pseudomonadales bacterium]|jgi:hypothetical protein|nr:hypothetical protein [Pseudomonadales bacterium]